MPATTQRIVLQVSPDDYDAIKEAADDKGIAVAQLLRRALVKYGVPVAASSG